MPRNSEELFQRMLNQKTVEARDAVAKCLKLLLSPKSEQHREQQLKSAEDAVQRLRDMLNPTDIPPWLKELATQLNGARTTSNIDYLMQVATRTYPALQSHQWNFNEPSSIGFDFDAVFKRYRRECRIPELFDEIIGWLKQIAECEELDSKRTTRELEDIIATLERAKAGSYLQMRLSWGFVTTWLKNSGWDALEKLPVAGSIFSGLRKTLEEADQAMIECHAKMQADFDSQVAADFPKLDYRSPEIPVLEHHPDAEGEGDASADSGAG